MVDQALWYSFFVPVPLVLWASVRWWRTWPRIASRRQRVVPSVCLTACTISALLIPGLFSILALLPRDATDTRFLVLLRALQVGLPSALLGLLLTPFAAKAGRLLASAASLLLLGHWYVLG